jgi:hypothetical protein
LVSAITWVPGGITWAICWEVAVVARVNTRVPEARLARMPGHAEQLHEVVEVGLDLGVDVVLVVEQVLVDVGLGDRLRHRVDDLAGGGAGGGVQVGVGDPEGLHDLRGDGRGGGHLQRAS